ncbi:GNAT family N-acetyltransferase [Glutamicibacter sp. JL.03c]|uniref:GNAT family N-acetyltransferase n=1 Tax=Glutamicibacter sp. JL.03c TaxID=2984842 RepID=UPI0021F7DC32|nr:GNAT family N-acetyltransferase [Glutamicibacter sp. JL.03c]UYQ78674.1 GNAT family N-acetyltransferase [Glutamicibacter sp. JL.03c]
MDTPSITVAEAAPQDPQHVQNAAKIWAQAAAQRDHMPRPVDGSQALAGVERRLALPDARLVFASKDGVPAGFTLCSPHDGYLEIYYVAVAPDFWGQGVARELMAEVENFARAAGFREVRLWAITDNSRAIKLYQANGWRPTGEELTDAASGRTEILLAKAKH